ncbi:hypothetical protein BDW62DRAFT_123179 [Aspergillus aurantiobrunneus]
MNREPPEETPRVSPSAALSPKVQTSKTGTLNSIAKYWVVLIGGLRIFRSSQQLFSSALIHVRSQGKRTPKRDSGIESTRRSTKNHGLQIFLIEMCMTCFRVSVQHHGARMSIMIHPRHPSSTEPTPSYLTNPHPYPWFRNLNPWEIPAAWFHGSNCFHDGKLNQSDLPQFVFQGRYGLVGLELCYRLLHVHLAV